MSDVLAKRGLYLRILLHCGFLCLLVSGGSYRSE